MNRRILLAGVISLLSAHLASAQPPTVPVAPIPSGKEATPLERDFHLPMDTTPASAPLVPAQKPSGNKPTAESVSHT